jgi:acetyltransferase-like isoleucine patch superfamily enzyme
MDDRQAEYLKLLAGEAHLQPDPYLGELQDAAKRRLKAFNDTPMDDFPARSAALSQLLGRSANCLILSPFFCDYGIHIEIGNSFVNANCTFLDSSRITIGDWVLIGTGVQLLAAGHPVHPADRFVAWPQTPEFPFRGVGLAKPIVIEDFCWIGAGTIILGGVTIGKGTTVGAGSVVTRSLPPMVVAAGNPCRIIRKQDDRPLPVLPPFPAEA